MRTTGRMKVSGGRCGRRETGKNRKQTRRNIMTVWKPRQMRKLWQTSVPIVSMEYKSGTATINAINISAEQVKDDGNVTIWAYGSGFVSAHVLYAMIDCRSD